MRTIYSLLLTTLFFYISIPAHTQIYKELEENTDLTFDEIVRETEAYFDVQGRGKGTGYKQFKRWEYFTKRSLDKDGKIISNADALKRFKKHQEKKVVRTIGVPWIEMGPQSATNTSTWSSHIGRVSALGIDPNDSDHLVIGSPGGGIWKTLDEGDTWTPIFDDGVTLSVWAILISHSNNQHYYAGVSGNGVMRSTDGGATWSNTSGTSGTMTVILMDPTNSDILLAMRSSQRVYRSTDGGANWTETDAANVITGNLYDMEFMPGNSNVVYVSGSNGVFKSEDNGVTFTEISGPWDALPPEYDNQPKMMAVTPDNPNYIYVLGSNSGGFGAVYRSINGGNTWTTQKTEYCDCGLDSDCPTQNIMGYNQGSCGGQAPRDMDIVVSDTDRTEVHVAGVETWKSDDSGQTFTQSTDWVVTNTSLPFIHADIDLMQYHNGKIYFGTDGGLFISEDELDTVEDKTTGLGIRQFYRIGVSKGDLDRVSGGSQDNGTGVLRDLTWYDYVGADGMETFIDKDNPDIIYASIQFGGLYKSINGGNSLTGITNPPGSGDWVAPLEQDPIAANTLYQGRQQVHKSTDGGASWSAISSFSHGSSRMVEITVAPSDNDVIYAAFSFIVYKTTDGGTNWTEVSPGSGFSNVNYISVHPTDPDRVLLTLSGGSSKLMESTDGGANWTDISTGLPSIGAECGIYENGPSGNEGIYVAMNPGVFYKDDVMATWDVLDLALPNVRVTELQIEHGQLYGCTYGRGLWKTDLIDDVPCDISAIVDMGDQECDEAAGTYVRDISVSYNNPPIDGFLRVNGVDYVMTGSPQLISLTLPLDGASVDVTASFSSLGSCSLTESALFNNLDFCPCMLEIDNTQLVSCDDSGTTDPSDDTFTISIDPQGDYLNATYSVTGDLTANNIPYGSTYVFDNGGSGYPTGAGEYQLTITDDVDPACNLNVSFLTPDDCSTNYHCQDGFIISSNGTYTAPGPSQGGGGSQSGRNANWYVFYPPSDGLMSVASCLQGVDTRLLLHTNGCSNLEQLLIIDDNCEQTAGGNNYASEIVDYCLEAGKAYFIEWDDRWSGASFDFTFTFTSNSYYADVDSDGFGDPAVSIMACSAPTGYVEDNTDCDDNDPNNYPGNTEICGDGVDNNCDGNADEGCTSEPCDGDYLVINTITQNTYRAEIDLDSDATLTSGQDILFTAQNSIDLEAGFEVPSGAVFEALIDYCVPTGIVNAISDEEITLPMLLSKFSNNVNNTFDQKDIVTLRISSVKEVLEFNDLELTEVEKRTADEVARLSQGIYILTIENEKDSVKQKVLIVE